MEFGLLLDPVYLEEKAASTHRTDFDGTLYEIPVDELAPPSPTMSQSISKLVKALHRSQIGEWIISLDPLAKTHWQSRKRAVNDFRPLLLAYQSMNTQLPPEEQVSLEIINRNETGDMALVIKSKGCSMKRHHRWWHDITKISYLRSW